QGGVLHHRERRGAHRPRASRRSQRVHHEAVRQGYRRGEVPGSRPALSARRRLLARTGSDPMTVAAVAQSPAAELAPASTRVLVVDGSAIARGTMTRWVESEPDMEIVAVLHGGRAAVEQLDRHSPDVVVLDVTMPDMDGITALPLLLRKRPDLVVL